MSSDPKQAEYGDRMPGPCGGRPGFRKFKRTSKHLLMPCSSLKMVAVKGGKLGIRLAHAFSVTADLLAHSYGGYVSR